MVGILQTMNLWLHQQGNISSSCLQVGGANLAIIHVKIEKVLNIVFNIGLLTPWFTFVGAWPNQRLDVELRTSLNAKPKARIYLKALNTDPGTTDTLSRSILLQLTAGEKVTVYSQYQARSDRYLSM